MHPLHESHNLVAALCQFATTSGVTVAPTARALYKDVSFGCGNVSGKVAKRKLACRRTPLDFVGGIQATTHMVRSRILLK